MNRKVIKYIIIFWLSPVSCVLQAQPFLQSYPHDLGWTANDVIELENRDILIGGSKAFAIGYSKMNVIRVDSTGKFLWNREYGYEFDNTLLSLVEDFDKNLILGGVTTGNQISGQFGKSYILKTNVKGDTIWTKKYDLDSEIKNNSIRAITLFDDNSLVAVGNLREWVDNSSKGHVLSVDTDGNLLWYDSESSFGTDIFLEKVIKDEEGNVYCLGKVNIADRSVDVLVSKYNKNGTKLWVKHFGDKYQDNPVSILLLENGNVQVNFSKQSTQSALSARCELMELSPEGDSLSSVPMPFVGALESCFSATGHVTLSDYSTSLIRATERFDNEPLEYELIRMDAAGGLLSHRWLTPFTHEDYWFVAMTKTRDDHLLMAGNKRADTCSTLSCLLLVKMTKDGDFSTSINITPPVVNNFEIFPNPTTGYLQYKYENTAGKERLLGYRIFTATGQLISQASLASGRSPSDSIDMTQLPNGVYFIKFELDNGLFFTERIVLQR